MEGTLYIAGTVKESIVDGPGFRYTIFTQGCPHHCPGCHNPQTHAFDGGKLVSLDDLYQDILKNPMLSGVTFSGGEPFAQPIPLARLAQKLHEAKKHVMSYTGYTFEQLLEMGQDVRALLEQCDLLVDGPYIEAQRSLTLRFRGSSNQRVLDVPKSLAQGQAVWAEQYR